MLLNSLFPTTQFCCCLDDFDWACNEINVFFFLCFHLNIYVGFSYKLPSQFFFLTPFRLQLSEPWLILSPGVIFRFMVLCSSRHARDRKLISCAKIILVSLLEIDRSFWQSAVFEMHSNLCISFIFIICLSKLFLVDFGFYLTLFGRVSVGCSRSRLMMLKETIFWLTMLIMLLMTLEVVSLQYILVCPLSGEAWLEVRWGSSASSLSFVSCY